MTVSAFTAAHAAFFFLKLLLFFAFDRDSLLSAFHLHVILAHARQLSRDLEIAVFLAHLDRRRPDVASATTGPERIGKSSIEFLVEAANHRKGAESKWAETKPVTRGRQIATARYIFVHSGRRSLNILLCHGSLCHHSARRPLWVQAIQVTAPYLSPQRNLFRAS